jgi:hypothetical protein
MNEDFLRWDSDEPMSDGEVERVHGLYRHPFRPQLNDRYGCEGCQKPSLHVVHKANAVVSEVSDPMLGLATELALALSYLLDAHMPHGPYAHPCEVCDFMAKFRQSGSE